MPATDAVRVIPLENDVVDPPGFPARKLIRQAQKPQNGVDFRFLPWRVDSPGAWTMTAVVGIMPAAPVRNEKGWHAGHVCLSVCPGLQDISGCRLTISE